MRFISLVLALVILSSASAYADSGMYSLTDLGVLSSKSFNGQYSSPAAVNSSGQVAGISTLSSGDIHAFLTDPNATIHAATDDLGSFGGAQSTATGVNDSGQVTGTAFTPDNTAQHIFRTSANDRIDYPADDLGTLGGDFVFGGGINASGQITGASYLAGNATYHAFRNTSGVLTMADDLGVLGGTISSGNAINASGQVVGVSDTGIGSSRHAFRTTASGVITAGSDLGTLGGTYSEGLGINTAGTVVGVSTTSGGASHAFLFSGAGQMTSGNDLGTLGGTFSVAAGINDSGTVVGYSRPAGNGDLHALVYSGGQMTDLNSLIFASTNWSLTFASAINASGQIVGEGVGPDGYTHAFLLTPGGTDPALAAVSGAGVTASVLGGSASSGGVQVTFDSTSGGLFDAQYHLVDQADLQDTLNSGNLGYTSVNFTIPSATTYQGWSIEYSGEFSGLATLVFTYRDKDLVEGTDEASLQIFHFNHAGQWVAMDGVVDTENNTITIQTDSFSPFSLGEGAPIGIPTPASGVAGAAMLVGLLLRRRGGK